MKVFITVHNRLTWVKEMCDYLSWTGHEPIILDNDSTYKPLIEWYAKCKYKVYRLSNLGRLCFWKSGLYNVYRDPHFIVTDDDFDLSGLPHDFANVMLEGFKIFPHLFKIGASLKLDDLPDTALANKAKALESGFWATQIEGGFYDALVDTTFVMFDRERLLSQKGFQRDTEDLGLGNRFYNSARTPKPYEVRHMPWYISPDNLSEEMQEYLNSTNTMYTKYYKEVYKPI